MTHVLNGKTLLDIQLSEDKDAIKFVTSDGDIYAVAHGDCCSHTWVETIESTLISRPAVVHEAVDIGVMRESTWNEDEYQLTQYYGFKITTDKGEVVIDYRNGSNGYYGGDLAWEGDYAYHDSVKDYAFTSIFDEDSKGASMTSLNSSDFIAGQRDAERYKIIGVCARSGKREPEFDGFLLSGIQGSVDPFASGHLERPDLSPAALLEWANAQVGKHLECAGLLMIAVATYGQTRIISE